MTQQSPSSRSTAVAATSRKRSPTQLLILLSGICLFTYLILNTNTVFGQESEMSEEEQAAAMEEESEDFDFFGNEAPISVSQLREMQEHFRKLSTEVSDATVSVQVGQNQGTGVIVTRDGYVMTAAHVIGGPNLDAKIVLPNGDDLNAKTLGLNRTVDSGLLKITDKGKFPYLNPGVSADLKDGQWVMAIGHPGGWNEDRGLVYRIGRILRKGDSTLNTDCSLVGGDSGGPLVDMNGDVIGIHSRIGLRLTDNVHVPVDLFSEQWDDLTNARDWGRGIGGSSPASRPWMGLSMKGESSLEIREVVPDGPADKAGLKEGDVLVEINESKIRNRIRLARLMGDPGDTLKIKIKRDDKEIEIELKVGSEADRNK